MAGYLGNKPKLGNYTVDEFTTSAAQASSGNFTLSQTVTDEKTLEVSVGGIDQPTTAYTVTGTTLAFGASTITQGDIVIARHAGEKISYPLLEDGAVTETKMGTGAVTEIKIGTGAVTDAKIAGMAASKLTGALPAISGASLTGVESATISTSNPLITTNPSGGVGAQWINKTTGDFYICTDATTNLNVWTNVGKGDTDVQPNDPPSNPTDDMPDMPENATITHTFSGATDSGTAAGSVDYYKVDNISNSSLLAVTTAEVAAGSAHTFTSQAVSATTNVTFRVRAKDNLGAYSSGITVTMAINNLYQAHFLLISGGGSGGTGGMSGGAGGGGLRTSWTGGSGGGGPSESQLLFAPGTTYTCTIGNGASGATPTGSQNQAWPADSTGIDVQGGVSSITGKGFTTINSVGGGTASGPTHDGHASGVGHTLAGGGPHHGGCGGEGRSSGGLGTTNQGFAGGVKASYTYAGGGGCGTVGGNGGGKASPQYGGGTGKQVNIDGNNYYWGGGGGGAGHGTTGGDGGLGGGGGGAQGYGNSQGTGGGSAINSGASATCTGSSCNSSPGGAGGANSGGGAGAGADSSDGASNGGSGCVIIRAPAASITGGASPTVTGSPTVATVGSDTVITFTGTGTFVA